MATKRTTLKPSDLLPPPEDEAPEGSALDPVELDEEPKDEADEDDEEQPAEAAPLCGECFPDGFPVQEEGAAVNCHHDGGPWIYHAEA